MNVTNVFFLEIWFLNLYTQQTIIMQTLMLKLFLFLEIPEIIFLTFKMK
ncbi:097L [Invertebrate iridescent virus Kaz2018]|nr:097L [Invertebrate iridescent virus Kaz2018]